MVIAFTGAQGVGKTTLLDVLEKCFSYTQPIEFVRNFTRDLAKAGYVINEGGTSDTQIAIMKKHHDILYGNKNVVMDRCMLDGIVYTAYLYRHNQVSEDVFKSCMSIFIKGINNYTKIFYIKPEFPITGDAYRSDKLQYQKDIADIFEEYINTYHLNVTQLTGTVGDRLSAVLTYLRGENLIKC